MSNARISKPAKNSMQSGKAKTKRWLLEFKAVDAKFVDPLMGWSGTRATQDQVHLHFLTLSDALYYAEKCGLQAEVEMPKLPRLQHKNYSDNFRYNKPQLFQNF